MFRSIEGGRLPERATRHSVGFDVFANEDVRINAGETKLIGLGICIDPNYLVYDVAGVKVSTGGEIIKGGDSDKISDFMTQFYFELHPRSSLRVKGLGGGVGIIDIDYRDEIKMVINNPIIRIDYSGDPYFNPETQDVTMPFLFGLGTNYDKLGVSIKRGDKIGQLILKRHEGSLLPSEYTLNTERNGGFGSTN